MKSSLRSLPRRYKLDRAQQARGKRLQSVEVLGVETIAELLSDALQVVVGIAVRDHVVDREIRDLDADLVLAGLELAGDL
jgi:hypothetical protein